MFDLATWSFNSLAGNFPLLDDPQVKECLLVMFTRHLSLNHVIYNEVTIHTLSHLKCIRLVNCSYLPLKMH